MSVADTKLRALAKLISDDGFAIGFQSMGQYRSALLAEAVRLYEVPPVPARDGRDSKAVVVAND